MEMIKLGHMEESHWEDALARRAGDSVIFLHLSSMSPPLLFVLEDRSNTGIIMVILLQIRKLRHREVKYLAQGCRTSNCRGVIQIQLSHWTQGLKWIPSNIWRKNHFPKFHIKVLHQSGGYFSKMLLLFTIPQSTDICETIILPTAQVYYLYEAI